MQGSAQALKDVLWGKLKEVFTKYLDAQNEIDIKSVEEIIVDVLKEESQTQVDYVMKNMFRIDVDNSGTVSFVQFGNFLFKRHCGQMSLQREHKSMKMSRGTERKMTLQEFTRLINNAYKFLGVACPNDVCEYIFKSVDKDGDQLITYVEYFKVIELYVCKGKNQVAAPPPPPAPVEPVGPERFSKLRIQIWSMLRRLYDAYVQGRSLSATDNELRELVFAIVGELSQTELNFLSTGLLQLNYKVITFEPFAEHFIFLIAELGLSRFSRNNKAGKKSINCEEFILILRNSFEFAKLAKFRSSILCKIFAKIDKNNDGLITFEEYLDWVKRFLAVLKYFGDEFWVSEDDADDNDDGFEKDTAPPPPAPIDRNKVQFVFSDYTFARQVRQRVLECLIPYDVDKNHNFDEKQIQNALTGLLNESEHELLYVTKNVFRYDVNNDGEVSYTEMTNFCVEQHFGEMAIQRLHRKKFFSRGAERVMNKEEFGKTLNIALEYINMVAPQEIIDLLFSEIDLDKDGWITYVVYFLFLRYYFGSCSPIAKESIKLEPAQKPLSDLEQFMLQYKGLNPWDRFVRIIVDQLRVIFFKYDTNKNQVFEIDEIKQILQKVFNFDQNQIEYIIYNYFSFLKKEDDNVAFDQLIAIILSIYFIEILFHRRYKSTNSEVWLTKKISLEEFILLITEGCYFIKYVPCRDDLVFIFKELDTDHDGFITFQQFVDFIRKYLGNGIDPWQKAEKADKVEAKPNQPAGISEEQFAFVNLIWDELKVYFDKYDQGPKGFLNEEELKRFVIEVLNETTERQLNYVFWNLFRVDSNANKEVDFLEFAPFILNHAGEIALQRFHREQTKGKNSLSEEELYIVFSNAFRFLSSMPKKKDAVGLIYKRVSKDNTLSYGAYMSWIHVALAGRYKKK